MGKPESHQDNTADDTTITEDFKSVDCTETFKTLHDDEPSHVPDENSSGRLTPKKRRQHNRSRFQTQTISESVTNLLQQTMQTPTSAGKESVTSQATEPHSPAKSKLSMHKQFFQRRLQNKDR